MLKILITGGAGFIGSNFLNRIVPANPDIRFLNVDCLTYAADLNYIKVSNYPNYWFSKTDIRDKSRLETIFEMFQPDWIIHIAAASHVDRSLDTPRDSFETNTIGTLNLLECCRDNWKDMNGKLYYYCNTDEIYGDGSGFTESTPYQPNTPYAASKACGGHIVRVYNKSYNIPTKTTCCCNNYGPNQHVEKFIPRMVYRIMSGETLTLHGDGNHTREWIHVDDTCDAIWKVLTEGRVGEVYNIGSGNCLSVKDTLFAIIEIASKYAGISKEKLINNIEYIGDRVANDKDYSTNSSKLRNELNWNPIVDFNSGLEKAVKHYIDQHYKYQRNFQNL